MHAVLITIVCCAALGVGLLFRQMRTLTWQLTQIRVAHEARDIMEAIGMPMASGDTTQRPPQKRHLTLLRGGHSSIDCTSSARTTDLVWITAARRIIVTSMLAIAAASAIGASAATVLALTASTTPPTHAALGTPTPAAPLPPSTRQRVPTSTAPPTPTPSPTAPATATALLPIAWDTPMPRPSRSTPPAHTPTQPSQPPTTPTTTPPSPTPSSPDPGAICLGLDLPPLVDVDECLVEPPGE